MTKTEIRKANKAARESQQRPTGQWIRTDARLAIYLRDGFKCVYCGADLHGASKLDVTLDHVHPFSKGGENTPDNLVTACRSCNCSRGARSLNDYADPSTKAAVKRQTSRSVRKYKTLARAIIDGDSYESTCDVWEVK